MSAFDKLGIQLKDKITLHDIKVETPQDVKTEKPQKDKLTIYLTKEAMRMLNELCSKNMIENGRPDKSVFMEKAIRKLYEEERNM